MRPLALTAGAVAAAFLLVGCGGSTQTARQNAPPAPHRMYDATSQPQHLAVLVRRGPMGDERVSPANFAVRLGVPVKVTVTNYTRQAHTFTSEELGVSVRIRPASEAGPARTTFTFRAQTNGVFRWYCALPCGDDDMGGRVYVMAI